MHGSCDITLIDCLIAVFIGAQGILPLIVFAVVVFGAFCCCCYPYLARHGSFVMGS